MMNVTKCLIRAPSNSQLTRCLSKKVDFVDNNELKQMSNKARVIALRSARNAKRHNSLLSKITEKRSGQSSGIPKYEIRQTVSVRQLSKITGAPLDFLLDEILSHVRCF